MIVELYIMLNTIVCTLLSPAVIYYIRTTKVYIIYVPLQYILYTYHYSIYYIRTTTVYSILQLALYIWYVCVCPVLIALS